MDSVLLPPAAAGQEDRMWVGARSSAPTRKKVRRIARAPPPPAVRKRMRRNDSEDAEDAEDSVETCWTGGEEWKARKDGSASQSSSSSSKWLQSCSGFQLFFRPFVFLLRCPDVLPGIVSVSAAAVASRKRHPRQFFSSPHLCRGCWPGSSSCGMRGRRDGESA